LVNRIASSERQLRTAVSDYVEHYDRERDHRGLANRLLSGDAPPADPDAAIRRRKRISGLLNYYHREAA
jgi:putative transposase